MKQTRLDAFSFPRTCWIAHISFVRAAYSDVRHFTSSIPKAHELVGVIELAGLGFESAHVAADTDVVHKEADTRSLYFRAATA